MHYGKNLCYLFLLCFFTETIRAQLYSTTAATNSEEYQSQFNPKGLGLLNQNECGLRRHNRISNGRRTTAEEFPWIALLRYEAPKQMYSCVGSLINDRYVLTAAQCLSNKYHKLIGIRLGEFQLEAEQDCARTGTKSTCKPPPEDFGIEKLIIHPHYSQNSFSNDVGLIRLNRSVDFKTHIKPICLPTTLLSAKPEDPKYIVAGWGLRYNQSNVLLTSELELVSRSECQKLYPPVNITENHICAGKESYTCHGDSGGLLVSPAKIEGQPRLVQFGILSFGRTDCKDYPNDVFTSIIDVLPWITDTIV